MSAKGARLRCAKMHVSAPRRYSSEYLNKHTGRWTHLYSWASDALSNKNLAAWNKPARRADICFIFFKYFPCTPKKSFSYLLFLKCAEKRNICVYAARVGWICRKCKCSLSLKHELRHFEQKWNFKPA